MTDPIISRVVIAEQAERAAEIMVSTQCQPPANPYPAGSAAADCWSATLHRFLLLYSTGEVSA